MISNFIIYIPAFIAAFIITLLATIVVRRYALKHKYLDNQEVGERTVHKKSTPLLGGVAIWFGFTTVLLFYALFTDNIFGGYMLGKHVIAMVGGGLILIIGGVLDDKYNLKPSQQIIWPIASILLVIVSGVGIEYLSNPFGEVWQLDLVNWKIISIYGVPYYITILADLFTMVWILGMIYTTKFLDGLDGLASGICVIASIVLFFLSISEAVLQPETALVCIILAGCAGGFLVMNWHPAKIFLGEGGSTFIGFMLGTLSIISGGKIATALLVMGIPILDIVWAIGRRLWQKKSPFQADRRHLHFKLLDMGFSQPGAVIILYLFCIVFGVLALVLQGREKFIAISVLVIIMIIIGLVIFIVGKNKKRLKSS